MSLLRVLIADPSSIGAGKKPLKMMIALKSPRTPAADAEIKVIHEVT